MRRPLTGCSGQTSVIGFDATRGALTGGRLRLFVDFLRESFADEML